MDARRTFVAIDLSAGAQREAAGHIERLRGAYPHVKVSWERPEKLHITLRFLGDTDALQLKAVTERLAAVADEHKAFSLRLSRTGVFPSRSRPRVLWIGIEDRSEVASRLCEELNVLCRSVDLKIDKREFRSHITIGRFRRNIKNSISLIDDHLKTQIEPVEFEVADVVIYESVLQPAGSIYSVISRSGFRPD